MSTPFYKRFEKTFTPDKTADLLTLSVTTATTCADFEPVAQEYIARFETVAIMCKSEDKNRRKCVAPIISRPTVDKLKSDGLITPNPSGFAVLGRFTATVKSRVVVKVAVKLKKSAESTLFEPDFNNFARLCKLNKTPHILTLADKSANKKSRPITERVCAVQISMNLPCRFLKYEI